MAVASQIGDVILKLDTTNIEATLINKFSINFEDQSRPGIITPLGVEIELINESDWVDAILTAGNWNTKYIHIDADTPYQDMSFLVDYRSIVWDRIRETVKFNANTAFLNTYKNERLNEYYGGDLDEVLVDSFMTTAGASSKFETNQYTHGTYGAFDFYDVKLKYYASGVDYTDLLANKNTAEFIKELCEIFGGMFFQYNGIYFQYKTWYGWVGAPSTIALSRMDVEDESLVLPNFVDGMFYDEDADETWTATKGDTDGELVNEMSALREFNLTVDFGGANDNVPVKQLVVQETLDEIYNYHIRKDKAPLRIRCEEFIPPGRKVSFGGNTYLVYAVKNNIFDYFTEASVIEL